MTPRIACSLGLALVLGLASLSGCKPRAAGTWKLTRIGGFFPDLQFHLEPSGPSSAVTAEDFRGKVVLLYFGYLHCPDVCPLTMAHLAAALRELGDEAGAVRVVFVSVDPGRDTPEMVREYAAAFTPQGVGITGTPGQIEAMAKRYRVAYQAETPDASGNYEVMHAKAVYVFDRRGQARLMIRDSDNVDAVVHDLRQLIRADDTTNS